MYNSICIVATYFGKFNNYFSLWLKSCEYNPKIDFYIFGDAKYEGNLPPNVSIIHMTLSQIQKRASDFLGFNAFLHTPYKCCDYKPIYGAIFKDYLYKYEYWGHCDIDLIFGDIYTVLKRIEYKSYDKIFPLGHLSLYRNSEKVINYIKLSGSDNDYKKVYTSPLSYAFDEIGGIDKIYLRNKKPFYYFREFADIAEPNRYKRFKHSQYCYINEPPISNYLYQVFYWDNGKVYCAYYKKNKLFIKEYCYIHLKKRPNFKVHFDYTIQNSFYITPNGFIERHEENITIDLIKELNPVSIFPLYECFEFLRWKYLKLVDKISRIILHEN